ncbi:hypothetical protein [Campylobacter geochelonis]|uniref:Uncharacterized protein n=1 Tax=Campylobacter geochelonis TaxID=1780362 RepID=A0A128EKI5_9BACT|nr:hypothetical protein [Campylobacter geochelonis]QKF71473.1 hypothetical protein CGEO_1173 [Campylobacter geochelonis]CZE49439.1 Uncharacterised protein [Campylobacter geochelonis]
MAKVDNLDGLLKELCKPIESLDVIENFKNIYGEDNVKWLPKYSLIIEAFNSAAENWDFCKTVDENLSKLIGNITQILAIEVATSKLKFKSNITISIVENILDDIGINLGNTTQKLYDLTQDIEHYFTRRSNISIQFVKDYDNLSDIENNEAKAINLVNNFYTRKVYYVR